MKKVDVLIATMNQSDFSLIEKMKVNSNAVIANQSDVNDYKEKNCNFGKVKMISTTTKGVGLNRNLALLYSESNFLIMADDDEILYDDYEDIIIEAFNKMEKADILIFNINTIGGENVNRRTNNNIKRVRLYNLFNYGAVRICIRKSSLLKANVFFTHLFGGGCKYSAGEDSLFLKDCLFSGLKIYTYPSTIADVDQSSSSWFNGYNEKYFYDKGCWAAATFPKLKRTMGLVFFLKTYVPCEVKRVRALFLVLAGCNNFIHYKSFEEWKCRE